MYTLWKFRVDDPFRPQNEILGYYFVYVSDVHPWHFVLLSCPQLLMTLTDVAHVFHALEQTMW